MHKPSRHRHLFGFIPIILAMLLLFSASACTSEPSTVPSASLVFDMKLWHIYTEICTVRRDVEATLKDKKLTKEEVQTCFKRNEATLKALEKDLLELKDDTNVKYSQQVRQLGIVMQSALAMAEQTYRDKRIADIKEGQKILDTLKELNADIPIQRTRHLIQLGCSTDQIYEIFRRDGLKDDDIQEYILTARQAQSEHQ